MPWSNQTGGGGWKGPGGNGGGGGPWGQGPRTPGPTPPDLEELLRRSQDRLKRVLPTGGGGFNPGLMVVVALAVVAIAAYTLFTFQIKPSEVGVVLRFGEVNRTAAPGLNFRLPYPIEAVHTLEVTRQNRTTIGQVQDDRTGGSRDAPGESLMLTGDENIIDIDFVVLWVIKDAQQYLFNLADPQGTVKAVAESAMREVVGRSTIQPLLTVERQNAERDVQQLMQQTLDEYKSGILIQQVQLLKSDPPADVIASFRDVQAARADAERAQNEAQAYANQKIPQARGQASTITEAANAYRDQVTAEAQGKADRFVKVYDQYKLAPDVTRKRMYLETIEQILASTDKILIDQNGAQGVVPYVPLPEIGKGGATNPTPAPPAAPRTSSNSGVFVSPSGTISATGGR